MAMLQVHLFGQFGTPVGKPEIPDDKPAPQVIIWGDEVFLKVDPDEEGNLRYCLTTHLVITETRERFKHRD